MKSKKAPSSTTKRREREFGKFDSFAELFEQAEQRLDYWVEGAKSEITEKIVRRMLEVSVTRSELAVRLGKKQSHITQLLRGNNNFTIQTMVQIAEALDCHFRCHLEPKECETVWIDVLKAKQTAGECKLAEPAIETGAPFDDADLSIAA